VAAVEHESHFGCVRFVVWAMVFEVAPSVITSKPAIRYHFKTGQRDWPKT
jgi:hypothetical protein